MIPCKDFARLLPLLLAFAAYGGLPSSGAPSWLTVERMSAPCGVDAASPRLGWKLGEGTLRQSAYRILVASSAERLSADAGDMWDSGKVADSRQMDVVYGGAALASSRLYHWKVKTWDQDGQESEWSAPSEWTTGIMRAEDWLARWIGPNAVTRPDADMHGAKWITAPPDEGGTVTVRRKFAFHGVKGGEIVEFVHAAVPQHDIEVNGLSFNKWVGHVHDARYARFRDLTPYLHEGENEVVVHIQKPEAGGSQAFLGKILFPDGSAIVSDASWGKDALELGGVRETDYGRRLVLRTETASPAFEKTFRAEKRVKHAVLHITGLGFYEATLNGCRVGDKVLDPSPTDYAKRVLYSTYDVTDGIRMGENALKVLVGHGWYDVRSIPTWNFEVAPWRECPRMIAQLEIEFADDSRQTVVSDGTWRQVESPVGYDCIREGEVVGAHHPMQSDFAGTRILAAEVPAPKGRLVAENCPGAKVVRRIAPKAIHSFSNGVYVVEFPENFAGWVRMKVCGQRKGDILVVRYDERVNGDFSPARPSDRSGLDRGDGGEPRRIDQHFRYTASHGVCAVGAGFQTDRFVSSGAETEIYEPRFTYNGFQYVVLKGLRQSPSPADIVGCSVQTDFPAVGRFVCSDDTLNELVRMAERSYRSNFADGVPTDCPHREKNGWTGDASFASEMAQYLFENTAGYEKWLNDIIDAQRSDGAIPGIVPTSGWGFRWGNGPAWDSALPVVAWNLLRYRDDVRAVEAVYPALKRYLSYTTARATENLVSHGLGDWCAVDKAHMPSTEFVSSCYYRQAAAICSHLAVALGYGDEARVYSELAESIRRAIRGKFGKGHGIYDNGGQTAQACALVFGIVGDDQERELAEMRLVEACENAGGHVDFGVIGSTHVFRALSRAGRTDLAFKMLTNPTRPSPADWIRRGGTTLWEDWEDGASRNHVMFGDFAAWAYQWLAGIRLAEDGWIGDAMPSRAERAFRHVLIAPEPISELSFVSAKVDGPYGEISSEWRLDGGRLRLEVAIPPNCTATVRLPGGGTHQVGAGLHVFEQDGETPLPQASVSKDDMQRVFDEVKTPCKVGMVLESEAGEQLDSPTVFRFGDAWYMTFVRYDEKGYETHLAKSDDLLNWKRLGRIFSRGEDGQWDSAQADGWPVLADTRWDGPNTLSKFGGRYWMMYMGGAADGYETDPLSTGIAWTDDPSAMREWTRHEGNPTLRPSDVDARDFEKKTIYRHFPVEDVSRSCGGRFVSFYNAKAQATGREAIGMAVSDDLINWRRIGCSPVLDNGDADRHVISGDPMIRRIDDVWVMFYFGYKWKDGVKGAFDTFACSYDLKHWTKWEGEPLVAPSEDFDCIHAHKPWVLKHDGVAYHFYCAVSRQEDGREVRGIALATSALPGRPHRHFEGGRK